MAIMFRLFHEIWGDDVLSWRHLYEQEFHEMGLRFHKPRTDTCGTCDQLNRIINDTHGEEKALAENDLIAHQMEAADSYSRLKKDTEFCRDNAVSYILISDLQQILQTPILTHGEYWYLQKYHSYNLGICNPVLSKSTMAFWTQEDAKRGCDEVCSCLWSYFKESFQPLEEGDSRSIIIWSDRCRGQFNNYQFICFMWFLISKKLFTEVDQKFLETGHTYNECDRHFALVELEKKKHAIYVPTEWIPVLQNSQSPNVKVKQMTLEDILSFGDIQIDLPKPCLLQTSKVKWIRVCSNSPGVIATKDCHLENARWTFHEIRDFDAVDFSNYEPHQKLPTKIPVESGKKDHLLKMVPYLPPEKKVFYLDL